jgi:hypothetical protein
MNRVSTVLATACLLAVLTMLFPAFGEAVDLEPKATTTHVTLKVLGDIKATLKLGFSHEYGGSPKTADTYETAWNFGTVIPQEGALVASEFSDAATRIEGYGWVMNYQSNAATQCLVEHGQVGDSDVLLLRPFFWVRPWEDSDFAGYFQPESEDLVIGPIPPSYGDELTFAAGIKIDMQPEGGHAGANPWSVRAGKYETQVISKWYLWQSGDDDMPPELVVTRVGYVYLAVANTIGKELGHGVGTSLWVKPESNTYTTLNVGERWIGAVFPWVLDYRSNSDFDIEVEIPPITLQGRAGAFDIRKHMKHYSWTDLDLGTTGSAMYPTAGGAYIFRDMIPATFGEVLSLPNCIELDLSGGSARDGLDRWKTPAGVYKPIDNISIAYSYLESEMTTTAHTLTISPSDFQAVVPKRQDGYELPESGTFYPEGGIKPEGQGLYEYILKCCQNHDRNVELSWTWSEEKVGAGKILWNVFWTNNVQEGVAGEGQIWKGIFKYSPEGNPSELGYSAIYEPGWTDLPGEKELIITMSHSPAV